MVRLLALLGLAALVALPAGATEIRNANSNKLLAVSGGSMSNGVPDLCCTSGQRHQRSKP
ncbi:MAG: hypothetical protein AAFV96_15220 [Pseudomonadota bacterium]